MRKDVPARVVITEYVDLAHAFFDGEEPKVVNGILDRLAHERGRRTSRAEGTSDALNGRARRRAGLGEFEIIARYFAPLATNPAALALRDDAAVLAVPEGQELVAHLRHASSRACISLPTTRRTRSATRRSPSISPISPPRARGPMPIC